MKQNRTFCSIISAIGFGLLILTTSCSETDYLIYDQDYSGVYFTQDSTQYSFGVTPMETREHVVYIPLQIMGITTQEARDVAFAVIPDSTTAQENTQYRIGNAIVSADSITGYIPITLLRDGLEGNYRDGYTRYRLGLQLKPNNNFVPTRNIKNQIHILTFDNAIEQPSWLDYKGDKVWTESMLGKWHPLKLIKMVEFFHELENILPETYVKIVAAYGENLENIPYGAPSQFKTTFNKYIFDPMYKYFKDPDNYTEIIEIYPDFPFDFPDPFGGTNGMY